jgi:outer membrane biogenesis lipoprotein LolB
VRPALLMMCAALLLTACGVQRPLIAPRDIPAYEAKRKKKQEDIRRYQEEEALKNGAQPAPAPVLTGQPPASSSGR